MRFVRPLLVGFVKANSRLAKWLCARIAATELSSFGCAMAPLKLKQIQASDECACR
jgi:hypothetical protein